MDGRHSDPVAAQCLPKLAKERPIMWFILSEQIPMYPFIYATPTHQPPPRSGAQSWRRWSSSSHPWNRLRAACSNLPVTILSLLSSTWEEKCHLPELPARRSPKNHDQDLIAKRRLQLADSIIQICLSLAWNRRSKPELGALEPSLGLGCGSERIAVLSQF